MEAMSTEWTLADQICQQAGIPRTQGRRATARLAEAGALQRRSVTWTSGKSRKRRRYEYRLPPNGPDSWLRFPAWMEPEWHPFNCTRARFIAGRNTFSKEHTMISEQELFELPRGLRERFEALPDSHFASHPEVAELRARLDDVEAQHREAAEAHHKLANQIRGLEGQAEWARSEAARLADGRPRRLAEIFISGDHDMSADRAVLAQIADLHHFSDAVELVYPKDPNRRPASEMARREVQAANATRHIVSEMNGLQDAYRGLLDRLKLAEAERLFHA